MSSEVTCTAGSEQSLAVQPPSWRFVELLNKFLHVGLKFWCSNSQAWTVVHKLVIKFLCKWREALGSQYLLRASRSITLTTKFVIFIEEKIKTEGECSGKRPHRLVALQLASNSPRLSLAAPTTVHPCKEVWAAQTKAYGYGAVRVLLMLLFTKLHLLPGKDEKT